MIQISDLDIYLFVKKALLSLISEETTDNSVNHQA